MCSAAPAKVRRLFRRITRYIVDPAQVKERYSRIVGFKSLFPVVDIWRMAVSSTKVAVVTGANKGIGLAIVRGLCKRFSGDVYLTARSEENGRAAVAQLEAEGLKPKFHQLDITSDESIEALRQYITEKYGGLDLLVNNAGIVYKVKSPVPFLEQATNTLQTNFFGTLNFSNAFLPLIRPHGRIVNISSTASQLSRLQKHLQEKF